MSRRRRQTRHRTFGPLAEYASPPRHNKRARREKTMLRIWDAFHNVNFAIRAGTAQFDALKAEATRAAQQVRDVS